MSQPHGRDLHSFPFLLSCRLMPSTRLFVEPALCVIPLERRIQSCDGFPRETNVIACVCVCVCVGVCVCVSVPHGCIRFTNDAFFGSWRWWRRSKEDDVVRGDATVDAAFTVGRSDLWMACFVAGRNGSSARFCSPFVTTLTNLGQPWPTTILSNNNNLDQQQVWPTTTILVNNNSIGQQPGQQPWPTTRTTTLANNPANNLGQQQ